MTSNIPQSIIIERVRNSLIDYFELVSDPEALRDYQRVAPVSVPNEVINQFEDNIPFKQVLRVDYPSPQYSDAEFVELEEYHRCWLSVIEELPEQLPALEEFIRCPAYERLRKQAAQALTVFTQRGRGKETT